MQYMASISGIEERRGMGELHMLVHRAPGRILVYLPQPSLEAVQIMLRAEKVGYQLVSEHPEDIESIVPMGALARSYQRLKFIDSLRLPIGRGADPVRIKAIPAYWLQKV